MWVRLAQGIILLKFKMKNKVRRDYLTYSQSIYWSNAKL